MGGWGYFKIESVPSVLPMPWLTLQKTHLVSLSEDTQVTFTLEISKLFYMFPCRTNLRQFSIRFQGPKFFNSLSNNIKDCGSILLFSKKLKEFLLSL